MIAKRIVLALAAALLLGCAPSGPVVTRAERSKPAARKPSPPPAQGTGRTVLAQWLSKRASGPSPATEDVAAPVAEAGEEVVERSPSEPPPKGSSIVGSYELDLQASPQGGSDPMSAMANGFAQMLVGSMELDLAGDSTFRMTVMGITVDGRYDLRGRSISLTPDRLMGLSKEEAKKLAAKTKGAGDRSLDGFEKPLVGSVSSDFSRMTLRTTDKSKEDLVFRRKRIRTVGKATVSEVEGRLVGDWRLAPDATQAAAASAKSPEERRVAQSILGMFSLRLNRDNTYVMRIMMPMEGRWKSNGSGITLTPTRFMGMSIDQKGAQTNMKEPMEGRVTGRMSRIEFAPSQGKGPALAFERAPKP